MSMTRKLLTTAAALAFTISGASAQFLLGEDASGHKEVTNLWAGERMDETRPTARRAARIPQDIDQGRLLAEDPYTGEKVVIDRRADERIGDLLDREGTFRGGGSGLIPGAPLGSDPITGEKRVVGGR
jgi:hypothetical protein